MLQHRRTPLEHPRFSKNCFQNIAGETLFSWIDINGLEHELAFIGSGTCNDSPPEWLINEIEITEIELLPITSVKYGPLKYASQKAVINVSPMKCTPQNQQKNYEQENRLLSAQEVMELMNAECPIFKDFVYKIGML